MICHRQLSDDNDNSAVHKAAAANVASKQQILQNATFGGKIYIKNGLPLIDVPLPSRRENCQFVLRPMADSVGSLSEALVNEDSGIEVVTFYTADGLRISKSTRIQHLLIFHMFYLRINDHYYKFELDSSFADETLMSSDKIATFGDVQSKIASLYTMLNIDDYKLKRENALLINIESVERELRPLFIIRRDIEKECEAHVERVFWAGFSAICFQLGVFARLTWWEYSWDIMEPITYFATFSTVVISLAYYIVARQNFEYSSAHLRILAKDFHRRALKYRFDVARFNELQALRGDLQAELKRLRDPLAQHLPTDRLLALEMEAELLAKQASI